MAPIEFIRQTATEPAFPDLIWSKPENRKARGKLLIVGGNVHGFASPAEAYQTAQQAGAGSIRVLLPEAIRKAVGAFIEHAEYGASNPSGSFSQKALGEWLEQAMWADCVLLAGDLGRNSETAIVIESFLRKFDGNIVATKDAANYMVSLASLVVQRPSTTLVVSMGQLQKLAVEYGSQIAFTLGMNLVQLTEALHEFTAKNPIELVVKHHNSICVAVKGQVSVTTLKEDQPIWQLHTAAQAAVWRMQNPQKSFEALTTSII